jgi:hypothetical protein
MFSISGEIKKLLDKNAMTGILNIGMIQEIDIINLKKNLTIQRAILRETAQVYPWYLQVSSGPV